MIHCPKCGAKIASKEEHIQHILQHGIFVSRSYKGDNLHSAGTHTTQREEAQKGGNDGNCKV